MNGHKTRIKSWLIIDFVGLMILIAMFTLASFFFYQKIRPTPEPNYYFKYVKSVNPALPNKDVSKLVEEVFLCSLISGIELRILYAIGTQESRLDPEALSPNGIDQGLWQINASQWGPSNFSITDDTRKACRILIYEKIKAHNNIYEMLRHYNSGKDGREYANKILQLARTIE